jgi:PilX N-terminal
MNTQKFTFERKTPSRKRSEGAVLVVSLILLLVMTLVGIAAIDSSSLQTQMARNSLFAQSLYQNSRSEIEIQYDLMKGIAYLERIMTSTFTDGGTAYTGIQLIDGNVTTPDPQLNYVAAPDPNSIYDQSANLTFTGDAAPPSGYSLGLFVGKNFEVNPVTQVAGTGSISDQTQGLNYPAPM